MRRWADILIVIVGVALGVYLYFDESPPGWLIRLGVAGAILAGVAFIVYAVADWRDHYTS